jgi:hypothetical protein
VGRAIVHALKIADGINRIAFESMHVDEFDVNEVGLRGETERRQTERKENDIETSHCLEPIHFKRRRCVQNNADLL